MVREVHSAFLVKEVNYITSDYLNYHAKKRWHFQDHTQRLNHGTSNIRVIPEKAWHYQGNK